MTSPHRDGETSTPASDEPITDLPPAITETDEVRGGAPSVSEIVITKPTDVASTKL